MGDDIRKKDAERVINRVFDRALKFVFLLDYQALQGVLVRSCGLLVSFHTPIIFLSTINSSRILPYSTYNYSSFGQRGFVRYDLERGMGVL